MAANASGNSLTNSDVRQVLGMSARGDRKHDIAAWFGVNQARIAEAEQGSHGSLSAAPQEELPPRGAPGPKGRRLLSQVTKAIELLKSGKTPQEAIEVLEAGLKKYNSNEA